MVGHKEIVPGLKSLLSDDEWWVRESGFDVEKINFHETIFTIGNGYLGTRGAMEESHRASLPGTYINGLFDHFDSTVVDLVNAPDWLPFSVWVEGEQLSMHSCEVLAHERILDIKNGLLYRYTRFKDRDGRITGYESVRYASFSDPHLCEMRIHITPENYSGTVMVESSINGNTFNLDRFPAYTGNPVFEPEVKWEKWAKSKHLYDYTSKMLNDGIYLESKTKDRKHVIGYASSVKVNGTPKFPKNSHDHVGEYFFLSAQEGKTVSMEKLVTIYTSRDLEGDVGKACVSSLDKHVSESADDRLSDHIKEWEKKWADCDVLIEGDEKANHAVRFNIYHLLICANPKDNYANIGAKSLSGEGYKGHVFWDTEIFMLPFYIYTQPDTAKALLMYRYNTLDGARENAKISGYNGARYPWESADTGLEETPKWTHDGKQRIWTGEEEIHVTSDVVFGLLSYHAVTGDTGFFLNYSAEILFETARFWVSRLEHNQEKDRYELTSVIGPDEFHEHVDNSVFTNWLAKWNLQQSAACYQYLEKNFNDKLKELQSRLSLYQEEVDDWEAKAAKVFISFDSENKMIEQFEGFFDKRDVKITEWDVNDMPVYPEELDHFSCNGTMLVKQPDVVMLTYILPDGFSDEVKRVNYEYYEARTMHKSSLSPSIHTIMGIETGNAEKAFRYFQRAAYVDLTDNQGNTKDGIHIASAGGTWQAVVNGFGGIRVKNQQLHFKPWLPGHWKQIQFKIKWKGDGLRVTVGKSRIQFLWEAGGSGSLEVVIRDTKHRISPNKHSSFTY